MIHTRFNPSLNGNLHLGHVFTCLVNEYVAHSAGGKFIIRFDDTSYTSNRVGHRMDKIRHLQQEIIEWLEIPVDEWSFQSDMMDDVKNVLHFIHHFVPPKENQLGYILPTSIRFGTDFIFYPYAPEQTAERVVMDNLQGITHIIRGEDFITEFSYYAYCCQTLDCPLPEFWCLPRLSAGGRDISKTNGGFTVAEYRANGYTPKEIKDMLAKSCLTNPPNGWSLYNIKSNPMLSI